MVASLVDGLRYGVSKGRQDATLILRLAVGAGLSPPSGADGVLYHRALLFIGGVFSVVVLAFKRRVGTDQFVRALALGLAFSGQVHDKISAARRAARFRGAVRDRPDHPGGGRVGANGNGIAIRNSRAGDERRSDGL
jgi:hypothetical protein